MWKGSGHWAAIAAGFVFAFHEKGKQLSFPFNKYGPSSDKAESILLQDVIAVLYHLRAEKQSLKKAMGSNNRRYRRVLCMILWFECVCYLDVSHHSSWLHSAGHIDRVAPDIIVRFTGSDHSSQNPSLVHTWREHQGIKTYTLKTGHKPKYKHTHTHTLTDSKHEVVEGLFVKVVEGNFHSQGKVSQVREVLPALNQWLVLWLWNDSISLSWWWSSAWTALVQQQADTLYHYL